MAYLAYVGFGSNLGNSRQTLLEAREALNEIEGVEVDVCSSLYETVPVGEVPQPDYVNMVVRVRTELQPEELLCAMQRIEQRFGRVRTVVWGPRTLDLDLLFYEDLVISTPQLTVPHPEIPHRGFVLGPMMEIDPEFVHPVAHQTVGQLYNQWLCEVGSADRYIRQLPPRKGNR